MLLSALEEFIRRIDVVRGIALYVAAALLIGSCSTAETDAMTTAPATTTTTTTGVTTTEPVTTSAVAKTTTTQPPTTLPTVATGRTLPVPEHAAPTIDGVLENGEWAGATETTMTDGSTLHWMRADESLYVALRGHSLGAVNLAIATPDRVVILHSSAALGSVAFAAEDGAWALEHDFDWCCRGQNNEAARSTLLDEEGWQATIGFAGDPGTVEYEVTVPWVDAAVATSYQTESGDPAFWPTDLTPAATSELIGPFPDEARFHIGKWYRLEPSDS